MAVLRLLCCAVPFCAFPSIHLGLRSPPSANGSRRNVRHTAFRSSHQTPHKPTPQPAPDPTTLLHIIQARRQMAPSTAAAAATAAAGRGGADSSEVGAELRARVRRALEAEAARMVRLYLELWGGGMGACIVGVIEGSIDRWIGGLGWCWGGSIDRVDGCGLGSIGRQTPIAVDKQPPLTLTHV